MRLRVGVCVRLGLLLGLSFCLLVSPIKVKMKNKKTTLLKTNVHIFFLGEVISSYCVILLMSLQTEMCDFFEELSGEGVAQLSHAMYFFLHRRTGWKRQITRKRRGKTKRDESKTLDITGGYICLREEEVGSEFCALWI